MVQKLKPTIRLSRRDLDGHKPSAKVHDILQPIYEYINEIRHEEPERASRIAILCLELDLVLKKLERRT